MEKSNLKVLPKKRDFKYTANYCRIGLKTKVSRIGK